MLQIALILFGVLLFVISSRFKDEIEYEEGTKNKGSWNYSNINTSSVKLLLNSSDAQYSESNIANELSKLADYILAKDKEERKEKMEIPEYVFDCHTLKGKRAGKTKEDFFREEQEALQNRQVSIFDFAN